MTRKFQIVKIEEEERDDSDIEHAKDQVGASPGKNEQQRLEDALRINKPLATAYYMREDPREFWARLTEPLAARLLDDLPTGRQAGSLGPRRRASRC